MYPVILIFTIDKPSYFMVIKERAHTELRAVIFLQKVFRGGGEGRTFRADKNERSTRTESKRT